MAFNQNKFAPVGGVPGRSIQIYAYKTTDSAASVLATDYFLSKRFQLNAGDQIHISASDGEIVAVYNGEGSASSNITPNGVTQVAGWATYVDTQYPNSGAVFTVSADTDTVLPNNAGTTIETQMPPDVTTFYNGSVITGRNGDNLDVMIYFKAVPSAANQWLDMWIDIGGSIGELYRQTFSFPRGSGVERGILYALPSAYTLGTWETNGGTVYCRSNASVSIYQINYNFDRSHKAI